MRTARIKASLATATVDDRPTSPKDSARSMLPSDRDKILQLAGEGCGLKRISTQVGFDIDWVAAVIDVGITSYELKTTLLEDFYGPKTRKAVRPE